MPETALARYARLQQCLMIQNQVYLLVQSGRIKNTPGLGINRAGQSPSTDVDYLGEKGLFELGVPDRNTP
jgi:hypothetical protein